MDFLNMLNMVEIQQLRKLLNSAQKDINSLDYDVYNILLQMYYDGKIINKDALFFDGFSDLNKEEQVYTTTGTAISASGSSVTLNKVSGLSVGDTITITDGTNGEGLVIQTINTTTKAVTFSPNTTFSYASGSSIYRSSSVVDTAGKKLIPFTPSNANLYGLLFNVYYSTKQQFPEEMKQAKLWYHHAPLLKRTIEKSEVLGATSITTYEPYGFNVGDYILIYNDASHIQRNKITNISTSLSSRTAIFTLETPLAFSVTALTSKFYSYDHKPKLSFNDIGGAEDFQELNYLGSVLASDGVFEDTYEMVKSVGKKETQLRIETKRPISRVKNLLTANQSSFETDQTTGFSTAANFSFTLDRPSWAGKFGTTYALRFTNTYNGRNDFSWQIVNNRVAVTPGKQYSFFGYCNYWNPTNANVTIEKIYGIMYFHDSAGNILQTITGEQFTPNGERSADWDKFCVSGPAPAGAATVNVRFYAKNVDVGSSVFIDALQLEEGAVPSFIWTLGGTTSAVNPQVLKYGLAYATL